MRANRESESSAYSQLGRAVVSQLALLHKYAAAYHFHFSLPPVTHATYPPTLLGRLHLRAHECGMIQSTW